MPIFPFSSYNRCSGDTKRIIGNFFSLSLLEAVNYLLPLMTLPYLVRVLGPAKFGVVAFAQAFIGYFVIVTDYGFYLSAPKNIATNRGDKEKVCQIFSTVMIIKTLFMIVSLMILTAVIFTIPKFSNNKLVFIFTFGYVLGDVIFPTWFFQGMERMKYITYMYFIAKLFFVVCIFVFIRSSSDYLYVPLFYALGLIIAGIASLWIIFTRFKIRLQFPGFPYLKKELKESWHFFLSALSISLYTHSGVFILGLLANDTFVGYYSAAEKLIRAVQRMLWAASQSIYPFVNKLASTSRDKAMLFLRKIIVLFGSSFFAVSLVIFIGAPIIVKIILGEQYGESVIILRILAFLPFIISMGNIFGIQTMLAFNMKEIYCRILLLTAALHISLAFLLGSYYKHIGIAVAVLLSEIFVAVTTFCYLRLKGFNYWDLRDAKHGQ
ncbi:MAG: flippase [bacterium]